MWYLNSKTTAVVLHAVPGPAVVPGDLWRTLRGPPQTLWSRHTAGGCGKQCLNNSLQGILRLLEHRDPGTMEGKLLPAFCLLP